MSQYFMRRHRSSITTIVVYNRVTSSTQFSSYTFASSIFNYTSRYSFIHIKCRFDIYAYVF